MSAEIAAGLVAVGAWYGLWALASFSCAPPGAPLAVLPAPIAAPADSGARASVLFVGDTHFGETYSRCPALAEHGYGQPLERLRPLLGSAEWVIANLETPLTARRASPLDGKKKYVHWGDPLHTPAALSAVRVRAVSLANNHAYDFHRPGLDDTFAALGTYGIASFGAGRSLREAARPYRVDVPVGGKVLRMAVIGAYERDWVYWWLRFYAGPARAGAYGLWADTITQQIHTLKAEDPTLFVVVFPHWGNNYEWRTAEQQALGREMVEAGADLVVGHGAHVLQEVEPHAGRWILYGLGNFVFSSWGRYDKIDIHSCSLAARLDLEERSDELGLSLALYFLESNNRKQGYMPHVLEGQAFDSAVRTLLEGGSLGPRRRAWLREAAQPGRDAVGPHLRIVLGTRAGSTGARSASTGWAGQDRPSGAP